MNYMTRASVPHSTYVCLLALILLSTVPIAVNAQTSSLPSAAGWNDLDIGHPLVPGGSAELGGTLVVVGAGTRIDDEADQFHFTYQRIAGDVAITVRLREVRSHDSQAVTGVMIRGALTPDAEHLSLVASGHAGLELRRRLSSGWSTLRTATGDGGVGRWLKIERRGALVTAYDSDDGASWRMVGSELIAFEADIFVGFAVSSHQASVRTTAFFDALLIEDLDESVPDGESPPSGSEDWEDPPPQPEDPDTGEETPVPPDDIEPTEPEPTDPGGSGGPGVPVSRSMLVFEPSSDHDSNVDVYVVQVVLAGPVPTLIAQYTVGKPAVVGGECEVEITEILRALPSGSYRLLLRAANVFGQSEAAASDAFSL